MGPELTGHRCVCGQHRNGPSGFHLPEGAAPSSPRGRHHQAVGGRKLLVENHLFFCYCSMPPPNYFYFWFYVLINYETILKICFYSVIYRPEQNNKLDILFLRNQSKYDLNHFHMVLCAKEIPKPCFVFFLCCL